MTKKHKDLAAPRSAVATRLVNPFWKASVMAGGIPSIAPHPLPIPESASRLCREVRNRAGAHLAARPRGDASAGAGGARLPLADQRVSCTSGYAFRAAP